MRERRQIVKASEDQLLDKTRLVGHGLHSLHPVVWTQRLPDRPRWITPMRLPPCHGSRSVCAEV